MVSAFCFGRLGFLERFCIPLNRADKCIIIHFLLYKTITKQICAPQTACIKSASASAEALLSVFSVKYLVINLQPIAHYAALGIGLDGALVGLKGRVAENAAP